MVNRYAANDGLYFGSLETQQMYYHMLERGFIVQEQRGKPVLIPREPIHFWTQESSLRSSKDAHYVKTGLLAGDYILTLETPDLHSSITGARISKVRYEVTASDGREKLKIAEFSLDKTASQRIERFSISDDEGGGNAGATFTIDISSNSIFKSVRTICRLDFLPLPEIKKELAQARRQSKALVRPNEYTVELNKGTKGVGMTLGWDKGIGLCIIKTIDVAGPAERTQKIKIGDRILGIQGKRIEKLSFKDVIKELRNVPLTVVLIMSEAPRGYVVKQNTGAKVRNINGPKPARPSRRSICRPPAPERPRRPSNVTPPRVPGRHATNAPVPPSRRGGPPTMRQPPPKAIPLPAEPMIQQQQQYTPPVPQKQYAPPVPQQQPQTPPPPVPQQQAPPPVPQQQAQAPPPPAHQQQPQAPPPPVLQQQAQAPPPPTPQQQPQAPPPPVLQQRGQAPLPPPQNISTPPPPQPRQAPPPNQGVPPPPAAVSHVGFEKYDKMKKAGLPDGAVMNAMARDGVQPPADYFAAVAPSPPAAPPPAVARVPSQRGSPPPPPPTGPPAASLAGYEKYDRMKSSGLPEGAILNAMRRDGVNPPPGYFTDPSIVQESTKSVAPPAGGMLAQIGAGITLKKNTNTPPPAAGGGMSLMDQLKAGPKLKKTEQVVQDAPVAAPVNPLMEAIKKGQGQLKTVDPKDLEQQKRKSNQGGALGAISAALDARREQIADSSDEEWDDDDEWAM